MYKKPVITDIMLVEDIKKAIIGEVHAYDFYEELAELAPNAKDRRTIKEIQRDEAKHFRWFTMILRSMGASMPVIPPAEKPKDFKSGVAMAIKDELEAAAFYRTIVARARTMRVKTAFTLAYRDEDEHAMLFKEMLAE